MSMTDAAVRDADTLDDAAGTRLHLSGVDAPIITRVTRQSARGMTVEQALPFLRLQTQVWDEAQKGSRIESVSVVVYEGLPRLVLDLAFDEVEASDAELASAPVIAAHRGVVRPRGRRDETLAYDAQPTAAQAATPRPAALLGAQAQAAAALEPRTTAAPARRESTEVFRTAATPATELKPVPVPAEVAGLTLSVMEQELVKPRDLVYRAHCAWERAEPHVQRAWALLRHAAQHVARRAAPMLAQASASAVAFTAQRLLPALRSLISAARSRIGSRGAAAPR